MGDHELNARGAGGDVSLTPEPWGPLLVYLPALFYLAVVCWLGLFAVVPNIALRMDPVIITSGSMQPRIRPGDLVLIRDVDQDRVLHPGTVITFADRGRGGGLTTHRVIAVNDDGSYRTRGDANEAFDSGAVSRTDIVGEAVLLVPFVGLPVGWLHHQPAQFAGWCVVTILACVVAARPPERRGDGEHLPPLATTASKG